MIRHYQLFRWPYHLHKTQIRQLVTSRIRLGGLKNRMTRFDSGTYISPCNYLASGSGYSRQFSSLAKAFGKRLTFGGSCVLRNRCTPRLSRDSHTPRQTTSAADLTAEGQVTLHLASGDLHLHPLWLREHCRCQRCFNSVTSQKLVDVTDFPEDLKPHKCEVEGEDLVITWPDGHVTVYSLGWLEDTWRPPGTGACTPVLWDKNCIAALAPPPVDHSTYMTSEEGVRQHISNLLTHGYSLVQQCPVSAAATDAACTRLCHVHETFFGRTWTFTSDLAGDDSAYTAEGIGAHTDNCYLQQPAGLQILHCLEHTGEGGLNLLIDGFHIANLLKQRHPESFEVLTQAPVRCEYIGDGVHTEDIDPIIKLHPITQQVMQIRYNPYDRAALKTIPNEQLPAFYTALRHFVTLLKDPANEVWFKLNPGTVLFSDNFRLFHGRSEFSGKRVMHGCYLSRDHWRSQARVFGLL